MELLFALRTEETGSSHRKSGRCGGWQQKAQRDWRLGGASRAGGRLTAEGARPWRRPGGGGLHSTSF